MHLSKVSIIIPYNKDRGWLNEAIQSVYNQTYEGEIELIQSMSDNRVGYNLNRGVEIATGDFIKYLCDDDMLTNNSIKDSVEAMKDNDFIHGGSFNFWKYRREIQRPLIEEPTLKDLLKHNHIHGGTLMYRADVFKRFGMFDETLTTGEEYDFNLKLLYNGAKLGYCNSILYKYRRHDDQKSLGLKANQYKRKEEFNKIKKRYV